MATNLRKIRAQIERAIEDKVINGLFKRRERLESNLLAKLKQNFAEEFAVDPTTKELRGSGNLVGELGLQNPAAKVAALETFVTDSFRIKSVAKTTARRNKSIRFSIEMASTGDILGQSFALQPNTNRRGVLTQLEGGGTKPPLRWLEWLLTGGTGIIVRGHDVIQGAKLGRSGLPYVMNTRPRPGKNWRVPFEHASSQIGGQPVNFVTRSVNRAAQRGNLQQSLAASINAVGRTLK